MNLKILKSLKVAKECLYCGGLLEPHYGKYHPYCRTLQSKPDKVR